MNWKNPIHIFIFAVNVLIILITLTMLVTGNHMIFGIIIILYSLCFACLFFIYWLPRHLQAKKTYGKPIPPYTIGPLGEMDDSLKSNILNSPVSRIHEEKSISGKITKFLHYEKNIENDDGLWEYEFEVCEDAIIGFLVRFKSSKSQFLNYNYSKGGKYFIGPKY